MIQIIQVLIIGSVPGRCICAHVIRHDPDFRGHADCQSGALCVHHHGCLHFLLAVQTLEGGSYCLHDRNHPGDVHRRGGVLPDVVCLAGGQPSLHGYHRAGHLCIRPGHRRGPELLFYRDLPLDQSHLCHKTLPGWAVLHATEPGVRHRHLRHPDPLAMVVPALYPGGQCHSGHHAKPKFCAGGGGQCRLGVHAVVWNWTGHGRRSRFPAQFHFHLFPVQTCRLDRNADVLGCLGRNGQPDRSHAEFLPAGGDRVLRQLLFWSFLGADHLLSGVVPDPAIPTSRSARCAESGGLT